MFTRKAPLKKDATRIPRESPAEKKRQKKNKGKQDKKLKGAVKVIRPDVNAKKTKDKIARKTISKSKETQTNETKDVNKKRIKTVFSEKKKNHGNRNNKSREAERAYPFESGNVAPWGRYAVVVFALVGAIFIGKELPLNEWGMKVSDKAQTMLEPAPRPIASVEVEGDFEYISREQLQKLLLQRVSGDFVNIDIKTIQQELAANEWVYSVAVSRIWPDALKVKVIEQQPIALWGNRGFLNRFGEVILSEKLEVIKHLPKLDGDINDSDEITKQYLHVAQLFAKESLVVTSLSIDEKKAWQVVLDNQFNVVVGQDNLIDKLDNFLFVYSGQLKTYKEQIKSVDLRYEHGLAVSWFEKESPLPMFNKESRHNKLLSNAGLDEVSPR